MNTTFTRIVKFAWKDFNRSKGLTFQAIFIMAVAIFIITSFFFARGIGVLLLETVEQKVDISVYFKKDTSEDRIISVKEDLFQFTAQIESISYISREKALENFLEDHQDDTLYLAALDEVEDNPFLPSLNIKAKQPEQYAQISSFLEEDIFANLIERISYNKNKQVIDKLFSITSLVQTVGIGLSLFFALLVISITFNTIKLTILSKKQEIITSRLVGASDWFIRGPFLVQGIFYGLFAVLIVDIVLFPVILFSNNHFLSWFDFNATTYLINNLLLILGGQLVFALILGSFSSLIAIRKHLKV